MELGIPIAALASLYYISDKSKKKAEGFSSSGEKNNQLESPDEITRNYPVSTDEDLRNTTVNKYAQPNQRTDKYFSKGVSHDNSINDKSKTKDFNSLTGDKLNTSDFNHNNMVPYFGAKIRGRSVNSNVHEQILDNMVGSGSQTIEKRENAPLFKPEDNIQHAHGAPNMNNFYQSRVNSSNRMANVKPWEEVQVGPGLAEGFTSSGSGGFNSGLDARDKYKPKGVDELRVKTNPKCSYELSDHKGPASYYIKKPSDSKSIGKVEKYLPDTYFENGPERYFTTTGAEHRPTVRSMNNSKKLENPNSVDFYSGVQTNNGPNREPAPTNYTPSDKCDANQNNYLVKQRNYTGDPREGDYGLKSIKLGKTNRDCNPQYTVFNGIKKTVGALFAPITQVLRPSRKEDIVENYRVYGNPSDSKHSGFVDGTNQAPNVTNRDMNVDKEEYFGNIQKQNVHSLNNTKHQVGEQQRESTTVPYSGIAGGGEGGGQTSYYSNYNQTNNETKESLVYSRTNMGNTSKFNNEINMSISRTDLTSNDSRNLVPTMVPQMLPPSAQHIGTTHISSDVSGSIGMDRMQPDILDAFKKNPYTHSLTSSV